MGDLRPDSLTLRYHKCGKPACQRAAQMDSGHEPYWPLTQAVQGKTQTRIIPAGAVETEARRVALQLTGQAVARRFNADHSDDQGPRLPCQCSAETRFAGRRPKTCTSALGP